MKISVLRNYQDWANRGYLTALSCPNHDYLPLMPIQRADGSAFFICPLEDYKRDIGLAEYLEIERKVAMAAYLHFSKGKK